MLNIIAVYEVEIGFLFIYENETIFFFNLKYITSDCVHFDLQRFVMFEKLMVFH